MLPQCLEHYYQKSLTNCLSSNVDCYWWQYCTSSVKLRVKLRIGLLVLGMWIVECSQGRELWFEKGGSLLYWSKIRIRNLCREQCDFFLGFSTAFRRTSNGWGGGQSFRPTVVDVGVWAKLCLFWSHISLTFYINGSWSTIERSSVWWLHDKHTIDLSY